MRRFAAVVFGSTTQMNRNPKYRQACAKPIPRFPELDSITTVEGLTAPVRIASRRICNAGLSLALPPGLNPSSLAKRQNGQSGNTRVNLTNGVWPIVDKMPSFMVASLPRDDEGKRAVAPGAS